MNGKKIKTIVAIILVLFVIIGCALAYAYVQTDIFKTPEQLFKKYLAKNVEELKTTNLKPFDEIFKLIKTIQYGLYYVDMGCAWLLATMACFDFEYIYSHLDEIASMSFFVYKKTIQKMKESYLITPFQKDRLKKFVRIAQKDRAAAS